MSFLRLETSLMAMFAKVVSKQLGNPCLPRKGTGTLKCYLSEVPGKVEGEAQKNWFLRRGGRRWGC